MLHIVKSVYLNYAQNVLIDGLNLENLYLTLKTMTLASIEIDPRAINSKIWNEAVIKFKDKITEKPCFIDSDDKKYNLIISANDNSSNTEIFNKLYPKLTLGGLLMVIQNPIIKSDLKDLKRDLGKSKTFVLKLLKIKRYFYTLLSLKLTVCHIYNRKK
nr:hypothetical protein [Mycoplasmopsis bovis]